MRKIIILTFMIILPLIAYAENITAQSNVDPINKIVQELNSDKFGMWVNGIYPIINLPANAKPEEVIAQAIKMTGFDKGHIKTYKIVEIRKVKLNAPSMENCSAALIESDLDVKVLLFKYEENSSSSTWWTRFYDIP